MKVILGFLLLAIQLGVPVWLLFSEGWVSGLVFFVVWPVLCGLLLEFHEIISDVLSKIFGRN